jgi:hypothetical protein
LTEQIFSDCTINDVPALEPLSSLSTVAHTFSVYILSHHVLSVLLFGTGYTLLVMLLKETSLVPFYSNAISTIKARHAANFSTLKLVIENNYSKTVFHVTIGLGSLYLILQQYNPNSTVIGTVKNMSNVSFTLCKATFYLGSSYLKSFFFK